MRTGTLVFFSDVVGNMKYQGSMNDKGTFVFHHKDGSEGAVYPIMLDDNIGALLGLNGVMGQVVLDKETVQ